MHSSLNHRLLSIIVTLLQLFLVCCELESGVYHRRIIPAAFGSQGDTSTSAPIPSPSAKPTLKPTTPTTSPSAKPTKKPTRAPSISPTLYPTINQVPPGSVFNLTRWYLQLPVAAHADDDSPLFISTGTLQTFSDPYFHLDENNVGLVFHVPVWGVTTSGSHNPRSELRETTASGGNFNWYPTQYLCSSLTVTMEVNQVPNVTVAGVSTYIVIGQIKGSGSDGSTSDAIALMEYRIKPPSKTGYIQVAVTADPITSETTNYFFNAASAIPLNHTFTYHMALFANATTNLPMLLLTVNGESTLVPLAASWLNSTVYFKAGCYLYNNDDVATGAGEVTFYSLDVVHTNVLPTPSPTSIPSVLPSAEPSALPTTASSRSPTVVPTALPTFIPSIAPTRTPSESPTRSPTDFPTFYPTASPTNFPTSSPSFAPSVPPSSLPSFSPSSSPSFSPSALPTCSPSAVPTAFPSPQPTPTPGSPTATPTSASPTVFPSCSPTLHPSTPPTPNPSALPSSSPTVPPSTSPTFIPSASPTSAPSTTPSWPPTLVPTASPSSSPTSIPTFYPTTLSPTSSPSDSPATAPSPSPSRSPSAEPTYRHPTASPSHRPTRRPSLRPSSRPTIFRAPTAHPTLINLLGITVVQTVEGIDTGTWLSDSNIGLSFEEAVETCLSSLSSSFNIVVTGIAGPTDDDDAEVATVVTYHVVDNASGDGITAANISVALESCVSSGNFTKYLHENAEANGVSTPLAGASSNSAADVKVINTPAPTLAPTSEPTLVDAPTTSPTFINLLGVTVVQKVDGIGSATWLSNSNVQLSFQETVVNCLGSLSSSVKVVVSGVKGIASVNGDFSTLVTYHVVDNGSGGATIAANVSIALQACVSSGNFTKSLQNNAAANGVSTVLATASSNNATDVQVIVSPAPSFAPTLFNSSSGYQPSPSPTTSQQQQPTHHQQKLDHGQIAGIVIGSVAALLILTGCTVFAVGMRRRPPDTAGSAAGGGADLNNI